MSQIIIDNQTNLSDQAALYKVVGCLAGLEDGYEVTVENNIFTLKESTQ